MLACAVPRKRAGLMNEADKRQLVLPLTPVSTGEFWTSKQRAASSLHEVSYRACFKPPLARYFIERFSEPGEVVHDPFMGRGTTPLEAASSRRPASSSRPLVTR